MRFFYCRMAIYVMTAGALFVPRTANAQVSGQAWAISNQPAPGIPGGIFDWYTGGADVAPRLNSAGHMAFCRFVSVGTSSFWTMWTTSGGGLSLVAQEGTQAPGAPAGAVFDDFRVVNLDDTGQVLFQGFLRQGTGGVNSSNDLGYWLYRAHPSFGPPKLTLLMREGSQAPGFVPGIVFADFFEVFCDRSGQIVFDAQIQGPGVDESKDVSLWSWTAQSGFQIWLKEGDVISSVPGGEVESLSLKALNGTGKVVLGLELVAGTSDVDESNNEVMLLGKPGDWQIVVREGDPTPSHPALPDGTTFACVSSHFCSPFILDATLVRMNDLGDVFLTLPLLWEGETELLYSLWVYRNGNLELVIDPETNEPVVSIPGVINHDGRIAYMSGGINNEGIWYEDETGTLTLLAREGSQAHDMPLGVTYWRLRQPNWSRNGHLYFMGQLQGEGISGPPQANTGIWVRELTGLVRLIVREKTNLVVTPGVSWPLSEIGWINAGSFFGSTTGGEDGRASAFSDIGELGIHAGFSGSPAAATMIFGDSDGDGLLDKWELFGIDVNYDGVIDLILPGADPNHKDLYVEVDAMEGRAPADLESPPTDVVNAGLSTGTVLDHVIHAFLNAPNELVNNPNGLDGIALHIQLDETDVPLAAWPSNIAGLWAAFDAIKQEDSLDPTRPAFGTQVEREDPNWLNIKEAKQLVYRYCIFADRRLGNTISGRAETPGDDFMITLGAWTSPGGTDDQQTGSFMHEFGHTLGLRHGGGDHITYKPNYHSVMNYMWQSPKIAFASSWVLNYSCAKFPDLDENDLSEAAGIGGALDPCSIDHTSHRVGAGPYPQLRIVPEQGAVDWNQDLDTTDNGVVADLNFVRRPKDGTANDLDGDGILDDGDGSGTVGDNPCTGGATANCDDNCPGLRNADQADADGNGAGDACITVLVGHEDWSKLYYPLGGNANFANGVHAELPFVEETEEMHIEVGRGPCLKHDFDCDDVVLLDDFTDLANCFSGPQEEPGFEEPSFECRFVFDADEDGDIDLDDFESEAGEVDDFLDAYTGLRTDCNNNGELDLQDILDGSSLDEDQNGVPDECGDCTPVLFGDVFPPPLGNGVVDIDDVLVMLAAFADTDPCTNFPGTDLFPCDQPCGTVDIDDILAVLAAFAGNPTCQDPCL